MANCSLDKTRATLRNKGIIDSNDNLKDKSSTGINKFFQYSASLIQQAKNKFGDVPFRPFLPLTSNKVEFNNNFFDWVDRKNKENQVLNSIAEEQINYQLRVINAIQSDKVRQPSKNYQGFINDLQKQGIPKEQIALVQANYKEGMTKDELAASLLADYTYTVEIETAKSPKVLYNEYRDRGQFTYNNTIYDTDGVEAYKKTNEQYEDITLEEYDKIKKEYEQTLLEIPTDYYSNLTVPGGTNYTENNINTPLITPSIKGHAQFSKDESIGWFRSSDRIVYKNRQDVIDLLKSSGQLKIEC